jgi:WD repeat-containing protein 61
VIFNYLIAHTDAIWGISWTDTDSVISISADGSIKEWSSETGDMIQPTTFPPPHPLALVSLSVSPDGRYVLYNSLEGTTALWDLHSRDVVGKFESFSRQEADVEPGEFVLDFYHYLRTLNASFPSSI